MSGIGGTRLLTIATGIAAGACAVAIAAYARLRRDVAHDSSRITAMQRLNAGLITAESMQDVCDVVDESLIHFISPDSYTFWMPGSGGVLECVAISSRAAPELKNHLGMRAEEDSLTGSVMATGEPVVSFDPQHDERISEANRALLTAIGIEAHMSFPLLVTGRKVGVMSLSWSRKVQLSDSEVSIVKLAASHAALAIDRIVHEERRSESAARLRAMLYSVGEGLVTTDSGGRILHWNRAIASMTTRSEEWARGRFAFEAVELRFTDGSDVPKEENPFLVALRDRARAPEPEDGYLMATVDGWLPVRVAASPVYEGKVLYGAIAVLRDVQRERELDEMRDSLISTVSHELRTPLTMVQGFAELMSDKSLSAEDRDLAASQISTASQRLGDLIDDILSAAAIEAGRVELILEDVSVKDAIDRALTAFPPDEVNRVKTKCKSDIAIRADFDRLVQVLTNLIGNAFKYSPDGGEVVVEADEVDGRARVRVIDHGIGIAPDDRTQLFTKFYRTRDAKSRHISGTGLGLYISKFLAESHGGTLEVESELGSGSTFEILLPMEGPTGEEQVAGATVIGAPPESD